jgi:hypothetical protein
MIGANFTEAAEEMTEGEIASLETATKQNSSSGGDIKSLLADRDSIPGGELGHLR